MARTTKLARNGLRLVSGANRGRRGGRAAAPVVEPVGGVFSCVLGGVTHLRSVLPNGKELTRRVVCPHENVDDVIVQMEAELASCTLSTPFARPAGGASPRRCQVFEMEDFTWRGRTLIYAVDQRGELVAFRARRGKPAIDAAIAELWALLDQSAELPAHQVLEVVR